MSTEIELKLRILPDAIAALRTHPRIEAAALGPWRVARLENRYFDTADHALRKARMALRLRRIGRRWVQTLKASGTVSGAVTSRGEWEMPVDGPKLSLYRLRETPITTVGSARSLGPKLVPLFTTNFRREARRLALGDGIEVEIAIDQGLVATGRGRTRRTAPICEVEIEVLADGREAAAAAVVDVPDAEDDARHAHRVHRAVLAFAAALAADVALLPLSESKAGRAYRLLADRTREPAKVDLPKVVAGTPATVHATAVLDACARVALENLHGLLDALVAVPEIEADRLAGIDEEFVHQARVAVRKLRSAARTFRRALGPGRAARINVAWRELGRMLGGLRDWDVLVESLPDLVDRVNDTKHGEGAVPALDDARTGALREAAESERGSARRALAAELASTIPGSAALLLERELLAIRRPGRSGRGAVEKLAAAWLEAQQARVVDLSRRIAVLDTPTRHELRIEIKRLRYGVEFFDGLFDAEDYLDLLSDLQAELGELTDAAVQRERVPVLLDAETGVRAIANYDRWMQHRLRKKLPKVAALAVRLELQERPWKSAPVDPS